MQVVGGEVGALSVDERDDAGWIGGAGEFRSW